MWAPLQNEGWSKILQASDRISFERTFWLVDCAIHHINFEEQTSSFRKAISEYFQSSNFLHADLARTETDFN